METKDFLRKLSSRYLWGNLAAMAVVVVLLCLGLKFGLAVYTHHNENIPVPNLRGMDFERAKALAEQNGLSLVAADSGYNKTLPGGCILLQTPGYGTSVKAGRTIFVTVNSLSSPTLTIPDVIDNSSVREATARLSAMGFVLLEPRKVDGEKDWVYGLENRGRRLAGGDVLPLGSPLRLLVGNGQYDEGDSDIEIDYTGHDNSLNMGTGGTDEFEEVAVPPTEGQQ